MAKTFNFSNFKKNNEKCIIFENYNTGEVVVKYNNFEKLKTKLDNYIIVYNPNNQTRKKFLEMIKKTATEELILDGYTMVKEIFPLFTNIKLNLKDNEIEQIINRPPELFLVTQDEIDKIIQSIMNRFRKKMGVYNKLSKKEKELFLTYFEKEQKKKNSNLNINKKENKKNNANKKQFNKKNYKKVKNN